MSARCSPVVGSSKMKSVCARASRPRCAASLAAREGREWLAEPEVVEPDVGERLQAVADLGLAPEERDRLGDREVEHLADGAALPAHLEYLGLKPRAVALGAGHVDVGEKLHLDALDAVT